MDNCLEEAVRRTPILKSNQSEKNAEEKPCWKFISINMIPARFIN